MSAAPKEREKEEIEVVDGISFKCFKSSSPSDSGGDFVAIVTESPDVTSDTVEVPAFVNVKGQDYKVVGIGAGAFYGNTNVQSIAFGEASQIRSLEGLAIQGCDSLELFDIPKCLCYMDDATFRRTPSLVKVTVGEGNPKYHVEDDGCVYTKGCKRLVFVPRNYEGKFEIRQEVEEVGQYAFAESQVAEVVFAKDSAIKRIDKGAFWHCGELASFEVPDSVQRLGEEVFSECVKLERVVLSQNLSVVPSKCFSGCTAIKELCIPKNVKELHSKCFERMGGLETLTFAKDSELETIQADVFWSVKQLKEIELPKKLKTLDERNFVGCQLLQKVSSLSDHFKWQEGKKNKDWGSLVSQNGAVLHFVSRAVVSFDIASAVEVITDFAFYQCRNLDTISIDSRKSKLKRIGAHAFSFTKLKAFPVPDGVESIGPYAFANCHQLTSVYFPQNTGNGSVLKSIGRGAFSLTKMDSFNPPDCVASIGDCVFSNSDIATVKWPKLVESIGRLAFYGCEKLKEVIVMAKKVRVNPRALEGSGQEDEKPKLVASEDCQIIDHLGQFDVERYSQEELGKRADHVSQQALAKGIQSKQDMFDVCLDPADWTKVPGPDGPLNSGGFGEVWLAKNKKGELAAVKVPKGLSNDDKEEEQFNREVQLLAQLVHPCILGIIGFIPPVKDGPFPQRALVMEYCQEGSLLDVISKKRHDFATPYNVARTLTGIAYGLRYMHACGVLHRDIKPGNILMTGDFCPKIGDLGNARLSDITQTQTQLTATPAYAAPEALGGGEMTKKYDVYSFGIIVYELLSGRFFKDAPVFGNRQIQQAVRNGIRPAIDFVDPDTDYIRVFIEDCWGEDPESRPDMDAIVELFRRWDYRFMKEPLTEEERAKLDEYIKDIEDHELSCPPAPVDPAI